jgi:hypothetical protein
MLKHNELILIQTQEELNEFVEVVECVEVDALHIDQDYVAYMDEVVWIVPLSEIDETHFMRNIKPKPLKKWLRKQKRI